MNKRHQQADVVYRNAQFFRDGDLKDFRIRRHLQIQQCLQFSNCLLLIFRFESIGAILLRRAIFIKDLLALLREEIRLFLQRGNAFFS